MLCVFSKSKIEIDYKTRLKILPARCREEDTYQLLCGYFLLFKSSLHGYYKNARTDMVSNQLLFVPAT